MHVTDATYKTLHPLIGKRRSGMASLALEVGVGTNNGYDFRPRTPVNYTPVFLDVQRPSEELLEWNWVMGDAQYLPFRSDVFDMVLAHHVVEHLERPGRFIREAYRVLRGDGMLDLRTPNFLSLNAEADPTHRHRFSFIRLYRLLKRAGFNPTLEYAAASKIRPRILRKPIHLLLNLLPEELRIRGAKIP